ncbi:hypothetical protein BMS3Bbin12_00452 [bacterium BMS3Bbin12]|nr:hypothetical protein BMS3Abin12_01878 [bacterium BMS3Abin12]GBE47293.1 hypothetical protein BMS3Bbin12_00452 [bacterium BMS3Bbin12]GBE50684.1 hypothetical protein BMS3Bbin13_01628 [bacterium BMS3Bbin13]
MRAMRLSSGCDVRIVAVPEPIRRGVMGMPDAAGGRGKGLAPGRNETDWR